MAVDLSDEKQVRKRGEKAKLARLQQLEDLRQVAATGPGRRLLWRILEEGGMFRSGFAADPYQTAFNEGTKNQAVWLWAEIVGADPSIGMRLISENMKPEEETKGAELAA